MIDAEPTKKAKRDYRRHGLTRLLRSRMQHLDGRSALSQSIAKYRAELLSSLGGADNLSSMENTLVEMCSRDWHMLQHIDAYLFQTGIFNKRRRQAYALTMQRMQIADSLTRRLLSLGLSRRSKPVLSLSDYLTGNGTKPSAAPASPSAADAHLPSTGGETNETDVSEATP